jgi:hypothetical protein
MAALSSPCRGLPGGYITAARWYQKHLALCASRHAHLAKGLHGRSDDINRPTRRHQGTTTLAVGPHTESSGS